MWSAGEGIRKIFMTSCTASCTKLQDSLTIEPEGSPSWGLEATPWSIGGMVEDASFIGCDLAHRPLLSPVVVSTGAVPARKRGVRPDLQMTLGWHAGQPRS
jgi:hypothetical protein